jgi:crotonobetainyl-CoA:carnitine CoA-transferase CaiB-like acyl-CoA transferase
MMGGLAYMTGPTGRPLRAGASVIDVTGAMFGVIGILAALHARGREGPQGQGRAITSALYETTAFLVGQHMAQAAVTGRPAPPMPERVSAWAIYDVFEAADGQIFVGVVSDGQWRSFCEAFGFADWAGDDAFATNVGRVEARERILPRLRDLFAGMTVAELSDRLEAIGLPFAPIRRPQDLWEDPHLASGGFVEMHLPDDSTAAGRAVSLPALPLEADGTRPGLRHDLPAPGEGAAEALAACGINAEEFARLRADGIVE